MKGHKKLIRADNEITWSGMRLNIDFIKPMSFERGDLSLHETFELKTIKVLDHKQQVQDVFDLGQTYICQYGDVFELNFKANLK